jgi:hypothetical protein
LSSWVPVGGDHGSRLTSGGGGVPSPPEASFIMVKIGWLHGAPRTTSGRKRTTDRTKNYNLILSNCVRVRQVSANGLYHNILACHAPRHLDALWRTSSGRPYEAEIWSSRDALFLRGCTGSRESDTGHEYAHS